MEPLTLTFTFTKSTKNAHRYDIVGEPDPRAPYEKSFYIAKSTPEETDPPATRITITVAPQED